MSRIVLKALRQSFVMADSKTCSACKENLPIGDFGKDASKKDGKRSRCRECINRLARKTLPQKARHQAAKTIRREARRTHKWLTLCASECVDCGERNPICLEFDHIDPTTKIADIGHFLNSSSMAALKAEMAKCEVRCVNCHRAKTAKDLGHYSMFLDWSNPAVAEKYGKPWLTPEKKEV